MIITIVIIISSFLFISNFDSEKINIQSSILLLIILFEMIIFNKKTIELILRKINPEKNLSANDSMFQAKIYESLDEAEKKLIHKCSYKVFVTINYVYMIIALILMICLLAFNIGLLSLFIVFIIWIANYCIYFKETLKYSKSGKKLN